MIGRVQVKISSVNKQADTNESNEAWMPLLFPLSIALNNALVVRSCCCCGYGCGEEKK